jgi:hypothetical protein
MIIIVLTSDIVMYNNNNKIANLSQLQITL